MLFIDHMLKICHGPYQGFFTLTTPLLTSVLLAGRQYVLGCVFRKIVLALGQIHLL